MDKLAEDFERSLFNNSKEILEEYIEVGIDSFINDGILKDIPIVNTIVAVLKVGKNVHDRNLLRQTLTFIKEFNSGNISKDKLVAYKSTIENNPKKCEEELGRVLILLNNYIDTEKSIMLARLYRNYVIQEIDWYEFCEYSEIVNRIYIQDIDILKKIYEGENIDKFRKENYRLDRLSSLGLIHVGFEGMIVTEDSPKEGINEYGKNFVKIILEK